ncbi:restriction endonuclease subunit S [Deinococcus sp. RM]|uniref:restriction endonuclease subunit S n=1 Tax=Deinococcus sp. RM TaxID=2316359 RepID=UPI001314A70E|nr:restriction endonuclease subunit S [Deinococcus sp. RM]
MNIPVGWRKVYVDDIKANQPNALSTGPFGSAISSKYFQDSGVPVIRGSNLSNNAEILFKDEDFVYISPEKAGEFSRSSVRANDLIFTCWGTINQIGLIPEGSHFNCYIISNKQMKLTPDTKQVVPFYLYSLFSSRKIQKKISDLSIGSSIPGFNLGNLKSIELLLPPLLEQIKIASIISHWDYSLSILSRLIDIKSRQKRGLAAQLLTGKRRLPGFESEWSLYPLGYLLLPKKKVRAGKADYPILSVTVDGVKFQGDHFNKRVASENLGDYLVVDRGEIAMSGLNFWMGAIGMQSIVDAGVISPAYKVFRVNGDLIDSDYAMHFVRSQTMLSILLESSIQGASIVRRNLNMTSLTTAAVRIPSLLEQHAIAIDNGLN